MNKNIRETELSYYGLYLLNYLKEHRFVEAKDLSFVKSRADRAAEVYEQARREGHSATGHRNWLWQTSCVDSTIRNIPC